MKKTIKYGISVSLFFYMIVHYITFFFNFEFLNVFLSLTGLLALLFIGLQLGLKSCMLPIFLITLAVLIQLITGGSVVELLTEGVKEMRSLIVLLLIVPIISWVFQEEPYVEAIMNQFHKWLHTSRRFYFGIMIVNQIIAYFLLFGAIPMMYQFIDDFLKEKRGEAWEYLKGTALLRSFALTTMWVISIPSFAFAVDHLGASLPWAIMQGFLISLIGLLLAVFFAVRKEKYYQINYTAGIEKELEKLTEKAGEKNRWKHHVIEFAGLFCALFGLVFLVNILTGWSLLLIIPPIIFLLTTIYYATKKKSSIFYKKIKNYGKEELQHKSLQFSLMLAAGILIYSVNHSGIGNYFVNSLFFIENSVPFLNFLMILPFVVIALGFLGLGPLTVIVLVAGILENVDLPYPAELVVLSMTSGSVISVLLSPLILPIIVLNTSNKLGLLKNGFSFNLVYSIVFYFIVQIYLQIIIQFY